MHSRPRLSQSAILAVLLMVAGVTVLADPPAHPGRSDWKGLGTFIPYDLPYVQLTTDTSFVVRWRSRTPVIGGLRAGLARDAMPLSAGESSPATDHEIRLAGLKPGTKYFYALTADGKPLAVEGECSAVTHPLPGQPTPTRIWVVADPQSYFDGAVQTREAYLKFTGDRRTDVFLSVGDDIRFFEIYSPVFRATAFWPTIGNHDVADLGKKGVEAYYANRTLPAGGEAGGTPSGSEHYYSFDYGDTHLICLNPELEPLTAKSPMLTWLARDLAATKARWRIAYWHRPPYIRGRYDSDTDDLMTTIRQKLLPVLEAGGVDLVLNGHCHVWQRTGLLSGHYGKSDTLTEANRLNYGDGKPDGNGPYRKKPGPNGGTVYVVAGSSVLGSPEPKEHPAVLFGSNALGTTVIDVQGGRLHTRYLDARGKTIDQFVIEKSPPGPASQATQPTTAMSGS